MVPSGPAARVNPSNQAALHGLVQRLRDIGIPLISLTPVEAPITERVAREPQGN